MTILSTTVTPTTAYLGETVTLYSEVSETIQSSHLAMWIIDFDETTDSSTTVWELTRLEDKVIDYAWSPFASETNMSNEIQIDESMLGEHTITFILAQGDSMGISISSYPELFTIGDPINVSFKLHLYDKVKKLGNQWFYLKDEISTLLSAKEDNANKVTSLSSSSTNTQYPSAKAVYDSLPSVPSASSTIPSADTTLGSVGTGTAWARSDHTHPKSSLYAESIHGHNIEETDLLNVLNYINDNFDNLGSEIVFFDDCSSDMSSQYSVRGYIQEGTYLITAPMDITYNESDVEPSYILETRTTGKEFFTWFAIPNLRGLDNIRITATCMIEDYGSYAQIFLGLCDTLEQTNSSSYKFDFVRIRGDGKFDAVKNDIEQFSNNVRDITYKKLKLVFERIGNNITGKVYDVEEGTVLLSWNSYTTTNEYNNPYYFLGVMSKYSYYYELYELKAEQLII